MKYYEFDKEFGAPYYALMASDNVDDAIKRYNKVYNCDVEDWNTTDVLSYTLEIPYEEALSKFVANIAKDEVPNTPYPITATDIIEYMNRKTLLVDDLDEE